LHLRLPCILLLALWRSRTFVTCRCDAALIFGHTARLLPYKPTSRAVAHHGRVLALRWDIIALAYHLPVVVAVITGANGRANHCGFCDTIPTTASIFYTTSARLQQRWSVRRRAFSLDARQNSCLPLPSSPTYALSLLLSSPHICHHFCRAFSRLYLFNAIAYARSCMASFACCRLYLS